MFSSNGCCSLMLLYPMSLNEHEHTFWNRYSLCKCNIYLTTKLKAIAQAEFRTKFSRIYSELPVQFGNRWDSPSSVHAKFILICVCCLLCGCVVVNDCVSHLCWIRIRVFSSHSSSSCSHSTYTYYVHYVLFMWLCKCRPIKYLRSVFIFTFLSFPLCACISQTGCRSSSGRKNNLFFFFFFLEKHHRKKVGLD